MIPAVSSILFLLAACLHATTVYGESASNETNLWIPSRHTEIPATLAWPAAPGADYPLVVMAHGHGGSRDEAGGFRQLAAMLAEHGIASVRVDFPGCGESHEPLTANTIDSMQMDLQAARDFVLAGQRVDAQRVGLLGYSMGGRVAMLSAGTDFPYRALALWAPAASEGAADFHTFLGGPEAFERYRQSAEENGSVLITTPWGQQQALSLAWFASLAAHNPLQGMSGFTEAVLVLHGSADEIIPPAHSESIAKQLPRTERTLLRNANHGLGFYDDDPNTAANVLQETTQFFVRTLLSH